MIGTARDRYRRLLAYWVDGVRRSALLVLVAALIATGAGLYYAAEHLRISSDTADMLSKDLPFRQRDREFGRSFPQYADNIVVVIDGANPDLVQDAGNALAARLRQHPDMFPRVFDPESEAFFVRNGLLYLGLDELTNLSDRLADAEPLLAELARDMSLRGLFEILGLATDNVISGDTDPATLRNVFKNVADTVQAQAAGHPGRLSWRKLMMGGALGKGNSLRIILVQPKLHYETLHPAREAIDAIRGLARDLGPGLESGVRIRLTGGPVLDEDDLASVTRGATLAGGLSLLLVAGLLVIGLRSLRLVTVTLVTLVIGLSWTAAFATAAVGHLNLISVTFAVLFIGLGVDFGIQFSLRYREEVGRGNDSAEALRRAAAGVGGALMLAATAAAIGFFSFVPTAYVGLSELGIIAGGSMFLALFANLTVLPALLTLAPLSPPPKAPGPVVEAAVRERDRGPAGGAPPRGAPVARFIIGHPWAITIGALVLGLAALFLVPKVHFDLNPLNLSDPTTESVKTFRDLMRRSSAAAYTISVLAPDLQRAKELARRLEALPAVDKATTIADLVPKDQDEKLMIIDQMALFLMPVFQGEAPKAPPDEAQNWQALTVFQGKLEALLRSPKVGPLAVPVRRLEAGLKQFSKRAIGADPQVRERMIRDLQNGLLATLPARLATLKHSLEAGPVTIADLPADMRERLVSADGKVLVTVTPAADIVDNAALRRFVNAVRAVAPDATGSPVIMLEAGNAVIAAFREAGGIAFVGIVLLLIVVLRSAWDIILVLLPLALAASLTVAATVLFGMSFNFANIIALPLLLTLGVAFGIHLVLRRRDVASVAEMLRTSTPRAVLFSALTTMSSFGTLAVSPHRGTASMGLLLTLSLTLALVCTLVVLPAMLELRTRHFGGGGGKARP